MRLKGLSAMAALLLVLGCKARSGNGALNSPTNAEAPASEGALKHDREFRGVWISTVYNLDWPSSSSLSADQQKAEMVALLDSLQAHRMNVALLQVRPEGDALYRSDFEPWSRYLTGTQGKDPGYDPLEFFVTEAHKRGIEAHAWMNPYRARVEIKHAVAPNHMAAAHPELVWNYRNLTWMEPGSKAVQQHVLNVTLDIVKRYDVDGIHIDDYFYPYPDATPIPDDKAYNDYVQGGGKLKREDWRRDNVDTLISGIYKEIKATKPWVKFGIAPFGLYRPGFPEGTRGLDQYTALYADPKKWVHEHWLDYGAPQLYWKRDSKNTPFESLLKWWGENNEGIPIVAGMAVYQMNEKDGNWDVAEIQGQLELVRKYRNSNVVGAMFFQAKQVMKNTKGFGDFLKTHYAHPAMSIAMPSADAPAVPHVEVTANKASVTHDDMAQLRFSTLYRQEGGQWVVQQVRGADAAYEALTPGEYAITVANKSMVESAPAMFKVN